jgi:hypothetical protein
MLGLCFLARLVNLLQVKWPPILSYTTQVKLLSHPYSNGDFLRLFKHPLGCLPSPFYLQDYSLVLSKFSKVFPNKMGNVISILYHIISHPKKISFLENYFYVFYFLFIKMHDSGICAISCTSCYQIILRKSTVHNYVSRTI